MPRPPAPLPTALGEAFTCAEALDEAVTERRLRAKDLETPFRGVRLRVEVKAADATNPGVTASPEKSRPQTNAPESKDAQPLGLDRELRKSVLRIARAYAKIMPDGAFFTGRTAALLYGAPIVHGNDVAVAVHAPSRAPRRRGVRARKVAPALAFVRTHLGLRMSSPASTWAMLAAELSVRELVTVGDAFVRVPRDKQGTPRPEARTATIDELRKAAAAGKRVGAEKLRSALELIRVGSASPLESEYRLDAAAAGLPEPELDVELFNERQCRIGITEFVYRSFGVLVEVEGDHHRTSRAQWNRDIEKYAAYAAEGWEIVRLTSMHIRGSEPRAASMVREVLIRRGWRPE